MEGTIDEQQLRSVLEENSIDPEIIDELIVRLEEKSKSPVVQEENNNREMMVDLELSLIDNNKPWRERARIAAKIISMRLEE